MSAPLYDPARWYWIVGGDETHIWSSAAAAYVSMSDDAYSAWREAGGNPTRIATEGDLAGVLAVQFPAGSPVASVPQSVSRAQAKIALHRAGLLDLVRTAVAADSEVQIWFDDALVWERNNPHIVQLGDQLIPGGAETVDELFIAAAQIAA